MHCTTTAWASFWRRGQQEEWARDACGKCVGCLWGSQKACLEAPVLALADFNKPFLLKTDASKQGLGAVLSKKQMDGQYYPVAYASQSLTVHEHNYHSTKQEFLALKWAVSGIPALQTFHCQTWQQPAHLYHDYTQFRCYLTPLGRITCVWFTFSIKYKRDGTMQSPMPWSKSL